MTYNIHGCVGGDGSKDPGRILALLRSAEADLIALQEVHNESARDRSFLDQLGDLPHTRIIFGPTLKRAGADYGNVLISLYPLEDVERIDLTVAGREPRGAIMATAVTPNYRIRMIATHLGLGLGERHEQMQRLMPAARRHAAATRGGDLRVLMGDINEWLDWGRPIRLCASMYEPAPRRATFPARFPLLALDRIWIAPGRRYHAIRPMPGALARQASDHRPLIMDL
jgi:endonuclease/exonuclease/phosphatase family metal-dependent hydrolase